MFALNSVTARKIASDARRALDMWQEIECDLSKRADATLLLDGGAKALDGIERLIRVASMAKGRILEMEGLSSTE